jgi:hypothetical protein
MTRDLPILDAARRMKQIHAEQAAQVCAELQRIEYLMSYAGRRLMNSYEVLQALADGKPGAARAEGAPADPALRLEDALEDALTALRSQHVAKQLAAQIARRVAVLKQATGMEEETEAFGN